jgi:hypothetical protein
LHFFHSFPLFPFLLFFPFHLSPYPDLPWPTLTYPYPNFFSTLKSSSCCFASHKALPP